jgi:hypothetical protein
MRARFFIIPLWFLGAAFAEETSVPEPVSTLREVVDSLDDGQVQKAIETLKTHSLSPEVLDGAERQRALLQGVVSRMGPGASLFQPPASAKEVPFLAEILDGCAGYVRLGALDAAALTQMDAALSNFTEKAVGAVILDLRGIPAGAEFDMAADLARRFCPKGNILFTIEKPNARQERILTSDKDAVFRGILIVLTDADTCGAAEALAATLRANAQAVIVGEKTTGGAVEFSDFSLGGGRVLRVAVSKVSLPGTEPLFPGGVKPDITISLAPGVREKIFHLSREQGVGRFVFDVERPRMNEAGLVANTNPEITEAAAQPPAGEELRDTVLQRALDLVTAIRFFKK